MAKTVKDNSLNFGISDSKGLIEFLKKFEIIDPTALIEIVSDNNGDEIIIKSATSAHTAVKIGQIPFSEIFEPVNNLPNKVQIGVFNLEKFIKVLNQGSETNKKLNIVYDLNQKTGDNYSKNFSIKYNEIIFDQQVSPDVAFLCAPHTVFADIPSDIHHKIFNTQKSLFKFRLSTEDFEKILKLFSIDTADEIDFVVSNKKLKISGKAFSVEFSATNNVEIFVDSAKISIKKEYFKYLDKECYMVSAIEKGLILESEDSDIKLAISAALDPSLSSVDDITDDDDDLFADDDITDDDDIFSDDDED